MEFPPELEEKVPPQHRAALRGVLSHDPRPSYQSGSGRLYGMRFADLDVRFVVEGKTLTVREVLHI